MAQLTLDIPDEIIPRLREAVTPMMIEGDAVDLENPTTQEVVAKVRQICISRLRDVVMGHEAREYRVTFDYVEMGIT